MCDINQSSVKFNHSRKSAASQGVVLGREVLFLDSSIRKALKADWMLTSSFVKFGGIMSETETQAQTHTHTKWIELGVTQSYSSTLTERARLVSFPLSSLT